MACPSVAVPQTRPPRPFVGLSVTPALRRWYRPDVIDCSRLLRLDSLLADQGQTGTTGQLSQTRGAKAVEDTLYGPKSCSFSRASMLMWAPRITALMGLIFHFRRHPHTQGVYQ